MTLNKEEHRIFLIEMFTQVSIPGHALEIAHEVLKAIGYPALVVGLLLDLIVNTTVASAVFLERPKELTVSARLTRHSEGNGWRRQRVALAIRTALLDNIDPNVGTVVEEDQPLKVTRVIDFRIPLPWLLSGLILVGWAALSRPSQPTTQPAQAGFFTPGRGD